MCARRTKWCTDGVSAPQLALHACLFSPETNRLSNSRLSMRTTICFLLCMLMFAVSARPASVSTISLDGGWHFLADPDASLEPQKLAAAANIRPTRIPSSWQSQFSDLRDYAGVAWYWRTISAAPPAADQVA